MITWDDFNRLDIRAGTVISAESFPKAKKTAYRLFIDFGEEGIKKSSAQLTKLYKPEDIVGKQVIAVVNFPPKQIADFISECLVLGVYGKDGEVILLEPERKVNDGNRVG